MPISDNTILILDRILVKNFQTLSFMKPQGCETASMQVYSKYFRWKRSFHLTHKTLLVREIFPAVPLIFNSLLMHFHLYFPVFQQTRILSPLCLRIYAVRVWISFLKFCLHPFEQSLWCRVITYIQGDTMGCSQTDQYHIHLSYHAVLWIPIWFKLFWSVLFHYSFFSSDWGVWLTFPLCISICV